MMCCNRIINIMGKQSGYAKQTDTQTREMMTVCRHIKISTNNNAMLIIVSVTVSMEFGMLYNYTF